MSPAVAASAVGQLFSEANEPDLAFLMRSIEQGDPSVASQIARRILGSIATPSGPGLSAIETRRGDRLPVAQPATAAAPRGLLSPRELHVLQLIARGRTNRQIAEETHRSINTIEAQLKSIYRKLVVGSRMQAVREAMQRGLLSF